MFKKKTIAKCMAIVLMLSSIPTNILAAQKSSTKFNDIKGNWAEKYINEFVNQGIISGYDDGTFRPSNNVTRAEFVTTVNKTFGFTEKSDKSFKDIKEGSWYYDDVLIAVNQGYINGYEDNTFRPNEKITREEACKIIGSILNVSGDGHTNFKDEKNISNWAIKYVDGLVDMGVINGYEDGTFKPKNNSTRAESVKVLKTAKDVKVNSEKPLEESKPQKPNNDNSSGNTENYVIIPHYNNEEPPIINPIPPENPEEPPVINPIPPTVDSDDLLDPNNPKWSKDSDGDGLLDAREELIKTNPNKKDTDGDGLNDKFELESELDPNKVDTDNNGVNDAQEDPDGDGLKNIEEQKYQTSALFEDTDGDDLNDYDEIHKYKTDPLKGDTDEDKIFDSKEIELGTNPNKKDSNNNGINDGDEKYDIIIQTPEYDKNENLDIKISGNISGESLDDLYITNMEDMHEFINKDIPGYVAPPFRIGNDNDTSEKINITFNISEELIKNNIGDEFAIYVYDKENQTLKMVSEPVVFNSSREYKDSFTVNDIEVKDTYLEYVLLNKTKWDEAWAKEILEPGNNSGKLDIVLAIDSSGSMDYNDDNDLRIQESIEFIDKLEDESRAAIVDFDSYATVLQDLTNDKQLLKDAINKIDSSGGTNISRALSESIRVLDPTYVKSTLNINYEEYTTYDEGENSNLVNVSKIDYIQNITLNDLTTMSSIKEEENSNKFIMLLTDGESYIDYTLIEDAKSRNIKIYTIGLGDATDHDALKDIADGTNGKYQYAEKDTDLDEVYDEIVDGTIDLVTDADKDGIPNYFEKNLRLENGIFLNLDPNNPDTDGDGLSDGEEITGKKDSTIEDFNNAYDEKMKGFSYYSRPDLTDTDGDGLSDFEEKYKSDKSNIHTNPRVPNVTNNMLLKFADLSYEYLKYSYVNKNVSEIEATDLGSEKYEIIVDRKNIDDWKVIKVDNGKMVRKGDLGNEKGEFGALAVKKGNNLIVAFTGTDITDPNDLGVDWDIFWGKKVNSQVYSAHRFMQSVLNKVNNKNSNIENIYITGHSLGGYLAQHVSYSLLNNKYEGLKSNLNIKALTFSSPKISHPDHLEGKDAPKVDEKDKLWDKIKRNDIYNKNIRNYLIDGDIIPFVGQLNLGVTTLLEDLVDETFLDQLILPEHSIYNYYVHEQFK